MTHAIPPVPPTPHHGGGGTTPPARPPSLVDTHCHLTFDSYHHDLPGVLARAQAAGVSRVVVPAIDLPTSHAGVALAAAHPGVVYAAVGTHPNSSGTFDAPSDLAMLRALAAQPGVVAIGEIGLDTYWDKVPLPTQQRALEAQLSLAAELALPVIIHNRGDAASAPLLATLRQWVGTLTGPLRARPGVLHSFSAPWNVAEEALALGFWLGFTGPLTYKNADDLRHIAARVPPSRLLVETDGPFLTPHPHRGQRNEPAYVVHIADRLAALHTLPLSALAAHTTANAEALFRLPTPAL